MKNKTITNKVKVINKHLSGYTGTAWLVKKHDKYYVISYVPKNQYLDLPETLIFKSDEKGKIEDWGEVGGGRNITLDEALEELEENNEL